MKNLLLFSYLLTLLCAVSTAAQPPARVGQLALADSVRPHATDLFSGDAPLSFTLTARMQAIVSDRVIPKYDSLAIKHPARLTYLSDSVSGATRAIPLALVVRGNFRRMTKNCRFPPLYVNFPRKRVVGTPFANQNKLKLVTHCQDEEYIVRESLVYKLYNLVTDLSFRTRLARVTYVDSVENNPAETHWAFLVEDEADVARRNAMHEIKAPIPLSGIDSVSLATMGVFEFMIGNIDWEVTYRHNVRMMARPGSTMPNVVPYDFDHAVIVDAAYATRADNTGQHIYRGVLYPGWLMKQVFARFTALKPQLYALYKTDKRLSQAYINQTVKYLDVFYGIIDSPKAVKKHFFNGDKGGRLFASFNQQTR